MFRALEDGAPEVRTQLVPVEVRGKGGREILPAFGQGLAVELDLHRLRSIQTRFPFFDLEHNFLSTYGTQGFGGQGRYNGVSGVALSGGRLYVVDTAGGEVEVYRVNPGT